MFLPRFELANRLGAPAVSGAGGPFFELTDGKRRGGCHLILSSDGAGDMGYGEFVRLFLDFGLTSGGFVCIVYSAGSEKGRCSPQNWNCSERIGRLSVAGSEEKSKNLSKVA